MDWTSRFDALHARARALAGHDDFGDDLYTQGLRMLLAALDERPPPDGRQAATAGDLLVGALVSRLHTQAQWRAHPGHAARDIPAPVIVMGIPRTGTTALHTLLSQDPQFQGIEKWLTAAPIVRPPQDAWPDHPQYRGIAETVARMTAIAPEVMIAHGVQAHEVDECLLPMAQSFTSNWYPSQLDVPRYDAWLRDADETASYRRYKDVLRLVGLNDDRRWLLKNPSHVFGIEAMLAVFPDACVIQTHRHPGVALASLTNLLDNIMRAYTGQGIDRARRFAREKAFWAEAMRRAMAMQDRHPGRFFNVRQSDIRRDPIAVVRGIYAHFDIALSDEALARFQAWAAANPPDARSAHAYEAIPDEAAIAALYGDYIERHAL
jgi:hypothetical protein